MSTHMSNLPPEIKDCITHEILVNQFFAVHGKRQYGFLTVLILCGHTATDYQRNTGFVWFVVMNKYH